MKSLLWLQGGACSGNSLSLMNAADPDLLEFLLDQSIDLLWHPSLSLDGESVKEMMKGIVEGKTKLDILVFEGSVILGPNNTGTFNVFAGRPMKDWLRDIAPLSEYIVAVGDCAAFGGIPAAEPNPTDSVGLQFLRKDLGGFLGKDFRTRSGLPVINISGCPAHPEWIMTTISMISRGSFREDMLDEYNRPKVFYSTTTQFGCPRQLYFTYKVATKELGHKEGCLYFNLGCRGPYTRSPCNNVLWNNQSSKTRVGTPCMGCTEFDFPTFNFFYTEKNRSGIPKRLPIGVSRGSYVTFAAIARGSAPSFLVKPLLRKKGDWIE